MKAAGLVMYRFEGGEPKFFIVHPGGPTWTNRDVGAWSIPKGEVDEKDTDVLMTAVREFVEETGFVVHEPLIPLGTITQKSGKVVHAWGFEDKAGVDPRNMKCNEIEIDHPRGSGNKITIPECDRGDFFTFEECQTKLISAQVPLIAALKTALDNPTG